MLPLSSVIPEDVQYVIRERYEAVKELAFEPFTGPLYDQDGNLRLKEGAKVKRDFIFYMDWLVEGVVSAG